MSTNKLFVENYLDAYKAMRERAVEVIKKQGKTLEVYEVLKSRTMIEKGWKEWPAYGTDEYDSIEEIAEEWKYDQMFWCTFEGKHGHVFCGYISMVRWNAKNEGIEVYFDTNDGCVSEWLPEYLICNGREAIYETILEFID